MYVCVSIEKREGGDKPVAQLATRAPRNHSLIAVTLRLTRHKSSMKV